MSELDRRRARRAVTDAARRRAERLASPLAQPHGEALIWYCAHCGMSLKSDPAEMVPRGCECEVPQLPEAPTKVAW